MDFFFFLKKPTYRIFSIFFNYIVGKSNDLTAWLLPHVRG